VMPAKENAFEAAASAKFVLPLVESAALRTTTSN